MRPRKDISARKYVTRRIGRQTRSIPIQLFLDFFSIQYEYPLPLPCSNRSRTDKHNEVVVILT